MSKFDIVKNGYDTLQVDDYINNIYLKYEQRLSEQKDRLFTLKNELTTIQARLQAFQEKDKEISKALVYAVEKADQIEESAKRIYDLEIKRVKLLYKRWEDLLLQVESKYPQINDNRNMYKLIEDFKGEIDSILKQNYSTDIFNEKNSVKQQLMSKGDNYIKNILNKMDYVFNEKPEVENPKPQTSVRATTKKTTISKVNMEDVMQAHDKENNRIPNISGMLTSISKDLNLKKGEILADKYLNSDFDDDEIAKSAYAKNITRKNITKEDDSQFNYAFPEPNETGFDLRDALNPKEDLDAIMSSFDFFANE